MADFVEVLKIKERVCDYNCPKCSMGSQNNGMNKTCVDFIIDHPEQAQEILLKWDKEHPIKTNADKFEEVFGFRPNIEACPLFGSKHCIGHECINCPYNNFWKQEHKESEVRQ